MTGNPIERTCRHCGARWLAETIIAELGRKGWASHQALARFSDRGCAALGAYCLAQRSDDAGADR